MNEFQRIDKRAKKLWRTKRLIRFAFLAAAALIAAALIKNTMVHIICGAVLLAGLIGLILYPILEYIQWSYMITDDRIEIKNGIIFHRHTIIPVSRIQHVCSMQGPLQRLFGLASVVISTSGSRSAIVQLSYENAERICAAIEDEVQRKMEKLIEDEQRRLGGMTSAAANGTEV